MATSVSRGALVSGAGVSGALVLVLAGCGGLPAGVDGDLTGGWAAMPELELMAPEAGVCLDATYKPHPRLGFYYEQVDCTEPHQLETFHVGAFEGASADRNQAPNQESDLWRTAYRECDAEDDEYLGADFRYGDLWLGVGVPTDQAWQAGGRWFRCDLVEHRTFAQTPLWPDTLRAVFASDVELPIDFAHGCFGVTLAEDGTLDSTTPVACTEPHQAEFVGVWFSDRPRFPEREADWEYVHSGCRGRASVYVDGSSGSERRAFPLGTIVLRPMSEEDWANGDRGFRCLLWHDGGDLTASLKGAGFDALPSA